MQNNFSCEWMNHDLKCLRWRYFDQNNNKWENEKCIGNRTCPGLFSEVNKINKNILTQQRY